jgi:hypothetical protein
MTGASAHREMASTLGDELVLATEGKARVYGVSMKDGAAILTSGHATNGAFWIDHDTGQWVTSTYWMNQLPKWTTEFNASGRAEETRKESGALHGSFYEQVRRSAASVSYQLDFAKALTAEGTRGTNAYIHDQANAVGNFAGHPVWKPPGPQLFAVCRLGSSSQLQTVSVSVERVGDNAFSANSYDRHVPLELFEAAFIPGTYHEVVAPVDIAAQNQPSKCSC